MTRADLLALDLETLAALTNRGLVKRAVKELDAGTGASVSLDDDATLRGRFLDGAEVSLPPGTGLDQAMCTCGAPGVCRHLLGAVLAYGRTAEAPPSAEPSPWSPGDIDDEVLTAAVGRSAVASARRASTRGYSARLTHASAVEPSARAELATCTVRFPVRDAVGHAVTDASDDRRGEVIALAVWAFRAAVEACPDDPPTQIDVGGHGSRAAAVPRTRTGTGMCTGTNTGTGEAPSAALSSAVSLVDELLVDGIGHAGPVLATALRRVRDELTVRALHWPAGTVTDIVGQLDDYAARGARYRPEELARLVTELHARRRASASGGTPLAVSQVLGSGEHGDTPLRRVRLTALGCRIGGTPADRTAEVFLAHGGAGIALVLRRRWDLTEGQELTGHGLAARRLAGSTLGAVASSNMVSENASRTPGRTLTVGSGRLTGTSVTPLGSAWAELPEALLVRDFAAHARTVHALPPRLVRPRVEADSVRVIAVHGVVDIGYDAAAQVLEATVTDACGTPARVLAPYNPYSPGGLDTLAAALDGRRGEVRHLSGFLREEGGGLVCDPIAVMTAEGVTVPDLAPAPAVPLLEPTARESVRDPITAALESALSALASVAARGLRHLGEGALSAVEESAARLSRVGLTTSASLVRAFPTALRDEGHAAAVGPWVEAQLHLLTAAELRSRAG